MKINGVIGKESEIKNEFNKLLEKYQDNPNEFINDYNKILRNLVIWFIANFNATGIIRNEIIDCVNVLISIREPICKNNCYKCSCDN